MGKQRAIQAAAGIMLSVSLWGCGSDLPQQAETVTKETEHAVESQTAQETGRGAQEGKKLSGKLVVMTNGEPSPEP